MKRSRIARSASLADVLMLAGKSTTDQGSSSHLWEAKRSRAVNVTCLETVVANNSPAASLGGGGVESLSGKLGFMKLVEECKRCRKWIPPMTDVFMYGGCAYCTEKCRKWQYEKDANEGRISPMRNNNAEVVQKKKSLSLMKKTKPPFK